MHVRGMMDSTKQRKPGVLFASLGDIGMAVGNAIRRQMCPQGTRWPRIVSFSPASTQVPRWVRGTGRASPPFGALQRPQGGRAWLRCGVPTAVVACSLSSVHPPRTLGSTCGPPGVPSAVGRRADGPRAYAACGAGTVWLDQ